MKEWRSVVQILWALDIFNKHPKNIQSDVGFFRALNARCKIKVDAIYIASGEDFIAGMDNSKVQKQLLKMMNEKLSELKMDKWFRKSHVILNTAIPQRAKVKKLTEFARIDGYDAILISKHSSETKKTKFLGTFTEMVASLSTVPVFINNPDYLQPAQIQNLLIALDDSSKKEREFKNLLRFFSVEILKIHLLHVVKIPFHYLFNKSIRDFVIDEDRSAEKSFYPIIKIANNAGIPIKLHLKHSKREIEKSILSEAKKTGADLITIIHRSENESGFLFGRVSMKLMQETDRPLLLFRP